MPFPASFVVLIIVFINVGAIPVPPTGHFAYSGAPELATGVWEAIAESTDPTIVMAVPKAGGQLSQRQPSTGGEVVTTITNYISYQCIDNNTFVATISGISYPSLAPISQCSIYFINETHRAINSLPLSGGICPNAAFAGFNLGPNGAFSSSNIYKYVDGVLPKPTSFVCQNGTTLFAPSPTTLPILPGTIPQNNTIVTATTAAATAAAPTASLPSPTPPSFLPLPKSGGAATPLGIWKMPSVAEIVTRDGFYASYYDERSNTLVARRSKYTSHQCLGSDAYKSTAEQFSLYLNGSTSEVIPSCETGKRLNRGEQEFLDIVVAFEGNECPSIEAVVGTEDGAPSVPFRFTLIEPLKGNPATTCGAAPSAAVRAAGSWKNRIGVLIAGVTAGLAVLLMA